MELTKRLYSVENQSKEEPSGSQDMIGIIYPGINRLDFMFNYEGGVFPAHIESNGDPEIIRWLESVVHLLPVASRPVGYSPLGKKNLDQEWIRRLGQTGKDCYDAIIRRDLMALGYSMNECMECWEAILPHTVRHDTIEADLLGLLHHYQSLYPGAMYSGCGGGYLYVVSEESVPGAFSPRIRSPGRQR